MATISGHIGSQSIEGYVRSLRRRGHLCAPGQMATLVLSTDFPCDPVVSDELVLYEQGALVMTGYVQKVSRSKPSFDWVVEGMDTYQRVQSTFLDTPMVIGHDPNTEQPIKGYQPLTTDYWIGYILAQCGASYDIEGGGHTVPQGVQLGLRTAHESLQDIMAYSSQYAWAKPDGTISVKRTSRNAANYTFTDFLRFEYKKDDEWTRTNIKVYGLSSGFGSRQQRVFANASVSLPNIIPDRISAIATPMIQTNDEAQRVADYMIAELGDVTWVATGTIIGNPNIHIGQSARMTYLDFDRTDVITSLESAWDAENGYTMQVVIGERCPRIAGWSLLSPPIFAGTTQHGVYKSTDGGINWAEFNTGLPTGAKNVTRLGFNSFYEGMAIVNGSLYYTDGIGTTWSPRSLPSPVNSAGDTPALGYGRMIAVDAMGSLGKFAVLTTSGSISTGSDPAQMRSWIYTCENSGSLPSLWTSTAMTTGSASSQPYNLTGWDLTANGGIPTAVLSSGSVWATVPNGSWHCEKITKDRNAWDYFDYGLFRYVCNADRGLQWYVNSMYDTPTDTIFEIYILVSNFNRNDSVYLYGCYGDRNDVALTDIDGFRYWDFIAPASLFGTIPSPTPGANPQQVWKTTITLDRDVLAWTSDHFREIHFNIFCLAKNAISPYPSLTHGDTCGSNHVMGVSPYGDIYHPGMPARPMPMPIASTLIAGAFYFT